MTLGPAGALANSASVRVVTYNIHSGLGTTSAFWRQRSVVERNLRAISGAIVGSTRADEPIDVVALNEVDFASRRSAWIDEAEFIADDLRRRTGERYDVVRGETWRRRTPGFEVRFGNAALVRHPIVHSSACLLDDGAECPAAAADESLPSLRVRGFLSRLLSEIRSVIALTLDVGGRPLDVRVTHLDAFVQKAREAQALHLLKRFVDRSRTTILLGDMNAVPAPLVRPVFARDRTGMFLTGGALSDARSVHAARLKPAGAVGWATFPSDRPLWPLDWVLASPNLVPETVKAIGGRESDHRGLFVRYVWAPTVAGIGSIVTPAKAGVQP